MAISVDLKARTESAKANPYREVVQEICSKEFGTPPLAIDSIDGQGMINNVYYIVRDNGIKVIVRFIESSSTYTNYDKEIWCLHLLRECKGFRVPKPLGRGRLDTFEYMLEEYIDGQPGNRFPDQLEVWRRLGACAAEFNRLPVSGCGEKLEASNGGQFTASWQQAMEQTLGCVFRDDYWTESGACSSNKLPKLQRALEELKYLQVPTGLVHIDLAPKNCIIEPNGGVALIDWEMAEGGLIPCSQLAAVAGWWGTESQIYQNFARGYDDGGGVIAGSEKIVIMLALANSLHSVRWAQDRDPSLVEEYTRSAATMIETVIV